MDLATESDGELSEPGSTAKPAAHEPGQPVLTIADLPEGWPPDKYLPIHLMLSGKPASIKKLHLPKHMLSHPSFLSRSFEKAPEIFELYTTLVRASAMKTPEDISLALAYAVTAPQSHDSSALNETSEENSSEDDRNLSRFRGEVRICGPCEAWAKMDNSKKRGKPESWCSSKSVVLFGNQEEMAWVQARASEGILTLSMRIPCICFHHEEEEGYQVIFTIKDCNDRFIAQGHTSSIWIAKNTDRKVNRVPVAWPWNFEPPLFDGEGCEDVFRKTLSRSFTGMDVESPAFQRLVFDQLIRYEELKEEGISCAGASPAIAQILPGIEKLSAHILPNKLKCKLCSKEIFFKNLSSWTRHIFTDLKPYTCLIGDCQIEPTASKDCWMKHDMRQHRRLKQWRCKETGCSEVYTLRPNFRNHLLKVHSYRDNHETERFIDSCYEETDPMIDEECCPICGANGFAKMEDWYTHLEFDLKRWSLSALRCFMLGQTDTRLYEPISRADQAGSPEPQTGPTSRRFSKRQRTGSKRKRTEGNEDESHQSKLDNDENSEPQTGPTSRRFSKRQRSQRTGSKHKRTEENEDESHQSVLDNGENLNVRLFDEARAHEDRGQAELDVGENGKGSSLLLMAKLALVQTDGRNPAAYTEATADICPQMPDKDGEESIEVNTANGRDKTFTVKQKHETDAHQAPNTSNTEDLSTSQVEPAKDDESESRGSDFNADNVEDDEGSQIGDNPLSAQNMEVQLTRDLLHRVKTQDELTEFGETQITEDAGLQDGGYEGVTANREQSKGKRQIDTDGKSPVTGPGETQILEDGSAQFPILFDPPEEILPDGKASSSTDKGIIPLSKHIGERDYHYKFLCPGERLNDTIIFASIKTLSVGSCHVFDPSYACPKSGIIKPPSKEKLNAALWVFSVYHPGIEHWSVVVANTKTGLVIVLDSCASQSSFAFAEELIFNKVLRRSHRIDGVMWIWEPTWCRPQENKIDCGVFTIGNATYAMAGLPAPRDLDVTAWRRLLMIVDGLDPRYKFVEDREKPMINDLAEDLISNVTERVLLSELLQSDMQHIKNILSLLEKDIRSQKAHLVIRESKYLEERLAKLAPKFKSKTIDLYRELYQRERANIQVERSMLANANDLRAKLREVLARIQESCKRLQPLGGKQFNLSPAMVNKDTQTDKEMSEAKITALERQLWAAVESGQKHKAQNERLSNNMCQLQGTIAGYQNQLNSINESLEEYRRVSLHGLGEVEAVGKALAEQIHAKIGGRSGEVEVLNIMAKKEEELAVSQEKSLLEKQRIEADIDDLSAFLEGQFLVKHRFSEDATRIMTSEVDRRHKHLEDRLKDLFQERSVRQQKIEELQKYRQELILLEDRVTNFISSL